MKQNIQNHLKTLSDNQKKRIIQWEIPYLICSLKKEYQVCVMHLSAPVVFPAYKNRWFIFKEKTGFPVFLGENSLGVLVCFQPLDPVKAQKIRRFIDYYFQKENKIKQPQQVLNERREKSLFPLLIKRKKKQECLKTAHELYLKTTSFAFLNAEDLKWKQGVFHEMNGVFVCVPSFQQLSSFQKSILSQDLIKEKLPCWLVMGVQEQETLPLEWKSLFHSSL